MKKLLIASTALVATASVAAADVTFSGYGRFGILYEENRAGAEESRFESRFRLNIVGVTETDGGVRFAALMRVEANDNADGSAAAGALSGARFQVSAGGFRVQAGNISGVTDAAEVINYFGYEPGLIGQTGMYANSGVSLPAFSSTGPGNNGLSVKYEMGDFAAMASYTDDHRDNLGATATTPSAGDTWEVGASYTFSGWTLGAVVGNFEAAGAGTLADNDWYAATLTGTVGVADVAFIVSDFEADADAVFGISAAIPVGAATTIEASISDGGAATNDTSYGIGFDHSLGGGVKLTGMVGSNAASNTIADLGVVFNF